MVGPCPSMRQRLALPYRLAWPILVGRQAAGTCVYTRNCRAGAGMGRVLRILALLSMPLGRRQAGDSSRAKLPDLPSTLSPLTVRSSLAWRYGIIAVATSMRTWGHRQP